VLAYGAMLSIIPTIPVAGTTSVLGIDLLSAFRALIDMIGNAVATASPSALRRYGRYEVLDRLSGRE
jgi:Na+/H+-dicarboxylate symporter